MMKQPAANGGDAAPRFPWPNEAIRDYLNVVTPSLQVKGQWPARLLVGLLSFLFRRLSWEGADRWGERLGRLVVWLKIRKPVAMRNLDIAFGARKTTAEKTAIYRASMINLARHIINYLRVDLMDESFWRERFEIENLELLQQVYAQGKGVILTGGHIGEWDLAGCRIGMAGYPIAIVAKNQSNPYANKWIIDVRRAIGLGTFAHIGTIDAIRASLARGEGVIMAIDQNMKRSQGCFVEWMGHLASTVRSNAWLARETGAPVIAGYAYRVAPGRFRLTLTEEIPWEAHPEDPEQELLINTQHQARAVEKIIYAHPELWLWVHRRWKTQPEGAPNPYA